jgi:formyl-CoA transferase
LNCVRTAFSRRDSVGDPVMRRGNRANVPTDLYPCAPGGANDYVYMHVPTRHMLDALMTTIGRPELVVDARFDSEEGRTKNGDELWDIIADWTRQRTKYEVMEALGPVGVPCGATLDSSDIFNDRHLRERGSIRTMHHPVRGDWEFAGPPVRLSGSQVEYKPSPLLGQHTEEILLEKLGMNAETVRSLREGGVV